MIESGFLASAMSNVGNRGISLVRGNIHHTPEGETIYRILAHKDGDHVYGSYIPEAELSEELAQVFADKFVKYFEDKAK